MFCEYYPSMREEIFANSLAPYTVRHDPVHALLLKFCGLMLKNTIMYGHGFHIVKQGPDVVQLDWTREEESADGPSFWTLRIAVTPRGGELLDVLAIRTRPKASSGLIEVRDDEGFPHEDEARRMFTEAVTDNHLVETIADPDQELRMLTRVWIEGLDEETIQQVLPEQWHFLITQYGKYEPELAKRVIVAGCRHKEFIANPKALMGAASWAMKLGLQREAIVISRYVAGMLHLDWMEWRCAADICHGLCLYVEARQGLARVIDLEHLEIPSRVSTMLLCMDAAWSHIRKHRFHSALNIMQTLASSSVEPTDDSARAHVQLTHAFCLEANGQKDKAKEPYRAVVQLGAGSEHAELVLSRLHAPDNEQSQAAFRLQVGSYPELPGVTPKSGELRSGIRPYWSRELWGDFFKDQVMGLRRIALKETPGVRHVETLALTPDFEHQFVVEDSLGQRYYVHVVCFEADSLDWDDLHESALKDFAESKRYHSLPLFILGIAIDKQEDGYAYEYFGWEEFDEIMLQSTKAPTIQPQTDPVKRTSAAMIMHSPS